MVRPLFLEFPDATADGHPMDLDSDASSEFLLGPDLLVAPASYPDELDDYSVEFPAPVWYDFWTGRKVDLAPPDPPEPGAPNRTVRYSIRVSPGLSQLPVYARAGAIVPMQPLVESTSETPRGALTLRVYAGDRCSGQMYLDDGRSFAYEKGAFLREIFACQVKGDSMQVTIGKREGSYPAWWKEIRVEIYGWTPSKNQVLVNGVAVATQIEHGDHDVAFAIADDGTASMVDVR
jgi:alpha-glucosidase